MTEIVPKIDLSELGDLLGLDLSRLAMEYLR